MDACRQGLAGLPFMRDFVRTCADGFAMGWHERNGGNLSYRLCEEDVQAAAPFLRRDGRWNTLPAIADLSGLGGSLFAVTRSGSHMRDVEKGVCESVGIVELDEDGGSWRLAWGFCAGGNPTSELASHLACHALRQDACGETPTRVLYHAHPVNLVALSALLPPDARTVSRALWGAMAECVIAVPEGVGVVPWVAPCGNPIARATAELIPSFQAVVWAHHGALCAGRDFADAFSRMHTIEKAAQAYLLARSANGGVPPARSVPDQGLRDMASILGLPLNEEFLD